MLRASEIGAIVREGVVTLLGRADRHVAREAAAEAVLRVAGVRGVANDVQVDLRGEDVRSDARLARAVLETLRWDV